MLSDVLPPLACLYQVFQQQDLDYSRMKPLVCGTVATLENTKTTPGQRFSTLHEVVEDLQAFNI